MAWRGGGGSFIPERNLDGMVSISPGPALAPSAHASPPVSPPAGQCLHPQAGRPTPGLSRISLPRRLSTDRCKPNDDQLWPAVLERARCPLVADFCR